MFSIVNDKKIYIFIFRLADNLPAATRWVFDDSDQEQYERGYKLGMATKEGTYVNNHLSITLKYIFLIYTCFELSRSEMAN